MPELTELIDLPQADSANVEAYELDLGAVVSRRWRANIPFDGPDSRYLPGVAHLDDLDVPKIGTGLREADAALRRVVGSTFGGQFEAETGATWQLSVGLEATAEGGHVYVTISSPRGLRFRRFLTSAEVSRWVTGLERSLEIGPRLLRDLNIIAPPRRPLVG